ncbi:TetR/AcrR family transcriptional regulator [Gluconacetobacter entanii]|uniref:Transcriptional regulator n=1 Tax=Gluconacetobacter entanii TaxID=108528 RepID=A0A318PUW9_9PROT|nr:TetR/AcrR family transcriptional regulator [Gluconacetobacter entanii]MBE7619218.1 TetR family transcriptional regulator [Komagataeibacter sp. FXV2]MCE2577671.1 TetR/AcrR family transcriptional regulator [Komagataeibacter sp. FNDCR1]MBY4639886.1 TetR/AcrR family transcriptional regulator [Gluconacetobacter entanii]MCW4581090.1 TetR/AcrR family transcriptional regulator [Gluconacetobacter entanii]MCW4584350.1 TetR/AcrR family transcriptional regulator [Gluconacetobacter entanii]
MNPNVSPKSPKARGRGRPPKDVSEQQNIRHQLIQAGIVALTEKGFGASGLDDILRAAGVAKGSFYHYFENKEDFGSAVIKSYARYFNAKLDRWLTDDSYPPLQRLRHFVEDAKTGIIRFDYTRGCLIGNLGQELAILPASFHQELRDVLAGWERRVATCLMAAFDTPSPAYGHICQRWAEFFWIGWEGAVLRARLERSVRPMSLFSEIFLEMVEAECGLKDYTPAFTPPS